MRAVYRLVLVISIAAGTPAISQQPVEHRRVEGKVVRPAPSGDAPMTNVWVTLHRVAPDSSHPLDSARTSRDGSFRFRYQATGDARAIYFASTVHDGVAYFAPPFSRPDVFGDDALITVFDTTSVNVAINVRGRHLVISSPDARARRTIIEVFELSNDSAQTLVPGTGERPTFTSLLTRDLADFAVNGGDVPAAAVSRRGGAVLVFAPIAPGLKQLSYAYSVPGDAFPLAVPLERATPVLEVLIEERGATATGGKLTEVSPVLADGRSFRRFLAQDVASNAVISVTVPRAPRATTGRVGAVVIAIVGSTMLAALVVAYVRRRSPRVRFASAPLSGALAREVAMVDLAFAAQPMPSDAERAAYQAHRDDLTRRLASVVAAENSAE